MSTTHELTYSGIVRPEPKSTMGPGLDGRMWSVVGSMYDTRANKTIVTVEAVA